MSKTIQSYPAFAPIISKWGQWADNEYLYFGRRVIGISDTDYGEKGNVNIKTSLKFHIYDQRNVQKEHWALCALRIASWALILPVIIAKIIIAIDNSVWGQYQKSTSYKDYETKWKQIIAKKEIPMAKEFCWTSNYSKILLNKLIRTGLDPEHFRFKQIVVKDRHGANIFYGSEGTCGSPKHEIKGKNILYLFNRIIDEKFRYDDLLKSAILNQTENSSYRNSFAKYLNKSTFFVISYEDMKTHLSTYLQLLLKKFAFKNEEVHSSQI